MTGPTDDSAEKSRKIKAQAMKILRETRAKIDPQLLSAMKERFSAMVPGYDADMPLSSKTPATQSKQPPAQKTVPPKASAAVGAALYSQSAKVAKPEPDVKAKALPEKEYEDGDMVPVDRQKVAQIVMEYMKLREGSKTRH
jgi:hypothetical protein